MKISNKYLVIYEAKKGVNPEFQEFEIKAEGKTDARIKANKKSGLEHLYIVKEVKELK